MIHRDVRWLVSILQYVNFFRTIFFFTLGFLKRDNLPVKIKKYIYSRHEMPFSA